MTTPVICYSIKRTFFIPIGLRCFFLASHLFANAKGISSIFGNIFSHALSAAATSLRPKNEDQTLCVLPDGHIDVDYLLPNKITSSPMPET